MIDEENSAPYSEQETFENIFQALRWHQIKKRVPICLKKTIRNRYILANIIYFGYAIGLLVIDFNPALNPTDSSSERELSNETISDLDQPVQKSDLANRLYIGKHQITLCFFILYQ